MPKTFPDHWEGRLFLGLHLLFTATASPASLPVLSEDAVASGKHNRHFEFKTVKGHLPATFYEQLSYFQGKFQVLWWIGKQPSKATKHGRVDVQV